jgi:hypothetical protein
VAAVTVAAFSVAQPIRVSPGPLSRAHASLEGITSCGKCHEPGRGVSAVKCLACHAPVASRIAARKGVHRAVTTACTPCHREHGGVDADLRRIDVPAFNHLAETGFALEGQHAKVVTCQSCHKVRSFLAARPACQSCHADPHKGALGATCTRCHSTEVPLKEAGRRFDHTRARFALAGAHRTVACQKCHVGGAFRGLRFERCSACHASPHRESFNDDCRSCHQDTTFRNATFDHGARTAFPLVARHAALDCRRCHTSLSAEDVPLARKVADFKGLSRACETCHKDQHKGQFGRACGVCHSPTMTFKAASGFVHPRSPEFFAGRHAGVTCTRCHARTTDMPPPGVTSSGETAQAKIPSATCGTCHADVHLGQVGTACQRCHAVDAARFAPTRFSHESVPFPLTGKHRNAECAKCHPSETTTFPGGAGTAKRLSPVSHECRSCHKDPHLGQVDAVCATCHSTATFKISAYRHPGQEQMFSIATHDKLPCRGCHKTETGRFPAGYGTTMRFKVGRTCLDCHRK